jgi:hypothetical protein
MGNSFLKSASKSVTDVRAFLRDSAGGNSIKYAAEKGAKHIIYIPYITETQVDPATGAEVVIKSIDALQGGIHEWQTSDGKFKAVACLKDVVRKNDDGDIINDGTCPFCDRITDAWNVYRYRKELEEATCQLTGEQRKQHLEKTNAQFAQERKAKEVRNYMYILVAKFRLNEGGNPTFGQDGLPEYELKVMKLSASRVEKIQQQMVNSGSELPDAELIFEYPNVDDRRLLVSQSTTSPVFPNNKLTVKYPALLQKINQDVAKFEWDGIEKAFPEWQGMSSLEAKTTMDNAFEQWDKYQIESKVNPEAKYLEYIVETPTTKPSLGTEGVNVVGAIPVVPNVPNVPNIPTVPNIPNVPTMATGTPAAPTIPNIPVAPAAPVAPDPNSVFGTGAAAPTVTI